MKINRERVLFIAFDYHEYARAIRDEIIYMGSECEFHSIQPDFFYLKIARRVSGFLYQQLLNAYHKKIIMSYPQNYFDQILFLQVHQFSQENLALLKARQSMARFSLYNWDAVTTHDYRPYIQYFDAIFTFDSVDAIELGINYLPLFCIRRFQNILKSKKLPLSVYFIGNIVNPRRYDAVKAFSEYCRVEGISLNYFLSTTIHGWCTMLRAGIYPRGVSFNSISDAEFISMMEQSSAVFDFANHRQSGFTMRTMENLCAGKKIITNNSHVRDAEFYSEDRFLIFDDLDFSTVVDFLKRPIEQPDENFAEYYVQNFTKRLLGR